MKCSKCAYERQAGDNLHTPTTRCPLCGIEYGAADPATQFNPSKTTPELNRPSPVDPGSLKKARERVEMRIRKQLQRKMQDQRHQQTLERARRIAAFNMMQARLSQKPPPDFTKKTPGKSDPSERITLPPSPQPDIDPADLLPAAQPRIIEGAEMETTPDGIPEPKRAETAPQTIAEPKQTETETAPQPAPIPIPAKAGTAARQAGKIAGKDQITKERAEPKSPLVQNTPPEPKPSGDLTHPAFRVRAKALSNISYTRFLSFMAWLILCTGLAGAILSYTTISVQADAFQSSGYGQHAPPFGLLLGFAYLATGILGFAFFWVASLISGQLKEILSLLLLQSAPAEKDRSAEH